MTTRYDNDPNALASALPAGISYTISDNHHWSAQGIAQFQAERLAESGYRLVYVGEATVEEEFCPRCCAGVASNQHHEQCVITGHAVDGEPAEGEQR